jgi:IclR family KDG regulon transcriptional repressor
MAKLHLHTFNNGKDLSQTLWRGLQILEFVAGRPSAPTIRQLSQELKLPKSVVHRLAATLEESEYLQKWNTGYRLGLKLWWLGCSAIRGMELRQVARPYLEELAMKTQELVNVAILDGKEVLYIDKLDCLQSVRAHIPIGGRAPAYCVATGKAILAHHDKADLEKMLCDMKRFTDRTVIGSKAMIKHLEQIRKRGYSLNLGEYHSDVGGIAAPIRNADGTVIAAVGVTAPIHRLNRETVPRLALLTRRAAEGISRALGYNSMNGQPALGRGGFDKKAALEVRISHIASGNKTPLQEAKRPGRTQHAFYKALDRKRARMKKNTS